MTDERSQQTEQQPAMTKANFYDSPANVIGMVMRSTLEVIASPDTSNSLRVNATQTAVMLLCFHLENRLPIPNELADFCAGYIPTLLKQDKRGAPPKHNQDAAFDRYRELTEREGMGDAEAKAQVLNELDQQKDGQMLDPTTISKSIEQQKRFLAFLKSVNHVE